MNTNTKDNTNIMNIATMGGLKNITLLITRGNKFNVMGVKGLVTSCEIVLKEVEKDFREKEISEDSEKDQPVIKEEGNVETIFSAKGKRERFPGTLP